MGRRKLSAVMLHQSVDEARLFVRLSCTPAHPQAFDSITLWSPGATSVSLVVDLVRPVPRPVVGDDA